MAGARYPMEFTVEELELLVTAMRGEVLPLELDTVRTFERMEAEIRFGIARLRLDAAMAVPGPCRRAGDATKAEVRSAVGQSGYGLERVR